MPRLSNHMKVVPLAKLYEKLFKRNTFYVGRSEQNVLFSLHMLLVRPLSGRVRNSTIDA